MAKELSLKTWKEVLNVSHRKFSTIENQIKRRREYYRGNQWHGEGLKSRYSDLVVDNMVFSNTRTILPRLNFRNPKIFTKPKKKPYRTSKGVFDTLGASVVLEILLNYYYKALKIKKEAKRCLVDALLGNWGIMQLGYTVETEKVKSDELLEVNELIKSESVFSVRRSPLDLRVDTESTDSSLDDARWVALRWIKTLDDIKANPKFENTSKLKPNFRARTDFTSYSAPQTEIREDETRDIWGRVEGWTLWDKKTHKRMDLVEGHDKFLFNDDWELDIEGFPVETLYFNENPDEQFPVADVDIYIDSQDELNRLRSLQLSHVRRISERKFIMQENALTDEEKAKLTHGGDGVIVETTMNPETSVIPVKDATISQDIYMVAQILKKSIRENAGISDAEALVSQKFEQATEPALISQSAQTIREDQRATFEDFTKRIVKKMATIFQQTTDTKSIPLTEEQFQTAQEFVPDKLEKIVGADGSTAIHPWLNLSKEDIKGEYDFDIEVGSTQPVNQEVRKRDAITLYQLLQQNPYVDIFEGTRKVLEAFDEKDTEKLMLTKEEVAKQQQQQAQQAMQAQMAEPKLKTDTDLKKTVIKTQTAKEVAKIKVDTDDTTTEVKARSTIATALLKGTTGAKKAEK